MTLQTADPSPTIRSPNTPPARLARPIVFINNAMETFTPTASGALATIIWENCRVAARRGFTPTVITRSAPALSFPWSDLQTIDYPDVPASGLGLFTCRVQRKLTGWRQLRHSAWARRVIDAIRNRGLQSGAFILINEPEMAVYLRDRFPDASILHWFQNQHDCKPRFRDRFAESTNVVVAVSNFTARWVESFYNLPANSVKTLYNAVDAGHFTPAPQPPTGKPVINFVGRTGIEKAPDLLLEAALRLAECKNDFSIQLVGSNHWDRFELDDYQRKLNDLVVRLESKNIEVRRPGHVGRASLPNVLRQAHIHVMPSRWDEPFGMTTLEGMACGLATAASRTGGTPEVTGDAAMLFNRDDVSGLTDILEQFLRNPALCREYAARARQRALEFTWDRCWSTLSTLLG